MHGWMKSLVAAAVVLAALGAAASATKADDPKGSVTVAGDVVCAKCTLKVAGLEHCQNVVVVDDGVRQKQFWLVDNEVNETFGNVCTAKRPVSVTGALHSRDGKQWLTPSRIEPRDR